MIKKSLFIFCLFAYVDSFGMEQKSLLEQLPKDLWIQILALASENLGNLVITNKFFNTLLSNEQTILTIAKKKSQEKITNDSKGWLANKIKQMWFNATEKQEMEKADDLITIIDPNVYDINQSTALEYAAIERRDPEMVKWLLDNGSDPKKVTKSVIVAPIEKRLEVWINAFSNPTIKQAYQDILSLIQQKIKEDEGEVLEDWLWEIKMEFTHL